LPLFVRLLGGAEVLGFKMDKHSGSATSATVGHC